MYTLYTMENYHILVKKGRENPQLFIFPEDMSGTNEKLRDKISDRTTLDRAKELSK